MLQSSDSNLATQLAKSKVVWLFKEGEPLPIVKDANRLRMGRIAEALTQLGCKVVWITGGFDHGKKQHAQEKHLKISDDLEIIFLEGPGYKRNLSAKRIWHHFKVANNFRQMATKLEQPDIILAAYPTPELCYAAASYAKNNGIPFFIDVRDPWPDSFSAGSAGLVKSMLVKPISFYYNHLLKYALDAARGVISMSEGMLDWSLAKASRAKGINDRVFYLGSDAIPEIGASPSTPGKFTSQKPLTCIFYGMFGRSHNGEVVIELARRFHERNEERVKFVMAGSGDLEKAWRQLGRGLDNLEFSGWLDKKHAHHYLSKAHIGVIAITGHVNSLWFGNKIFEYMSAGLAVVNDTESEAASKIKEWDIGINVKQNDLDSMTAFIDGCLDNPSHLGQLRENSYSRFQSDFEARKLYKKYAECILEVVGGGA